MIKTYYIHDNGGRPFKVIVDNNKKIATIFINTDYKGIYDHFIDLSFKKIFIGNSPSIEMTKFSAGYGKQFNGNSILLHINDNKYMYIGDTIYKFKTKNKIVKYVSPVGNNDVPYPYAIDDKQNYYLMIEHVIITNSYNELSDYEEPYEYYYNMNHIDKQAFNNINVFFIGNKKYNFPYYPKPEENYKRLKNWNEGSLYIKYKNDNKKHKLTEKKYVKIINDFGKLMNFKPLSYTIIQDRL